MLKKILFLFISFLLFSEVNAQKKISVLFIGNSLTYSNNLPEIVKQIAVCDSVELTYRTIAFPNYALIDHWNDGAVIKEINSRAYNFVVVQQGPSSQAEGRAYLIDSGLKLDSLCDKNKTKLVSYMVWPAKARSFDFQGVFDSYKLLADSAKAIFSPAGKAWLEVWEDNPEFKLYGSDEFHPNYNGSLLAALVIYGSIVKKNYLGFASHNHLKGKNLSRTDFTVLVKAAEVTLKESTPKKRPGKN